VLGDFTPLVERIFHRRGLCRRRRLHPSLWSARRNREGGSTPRAGGAKTPDLSWSGADQASGQNRFAGRQA
jgi:hypothetical protein